VTDTLEMNVTAKPFLEARDYIDVDALVARLRERVDGASASDNGLVGDNNASAEADENHFAEAWEAQAAVNEILIRTLTTVAECLRYLDDRVNQLDDQIEAEVRIRAERSDGVSSKGNERRQQSDDSQGPVRITGSIPPVARKAGPDLEPLRESLRRGLANVEAFIVKRPGAG